MKNVKFNILSMYCRYASYPEEAERLGVHEARELGEENKLLFEPVNISGRRTEERGGVEDSTLMGFPRSLRSVLRVLKLWTI